jgi:hypothetical protein
LPTTPTSEREASIVAEASGQTIVNTCSFRIEATSKTMSYFAESSSEHSLFPPSFICDRALPTSSETAHWDFKRLLIPVFIAVNIHENKYDLSDHDVN